jgi:hypothetical protein
MGWANIGNISTSNLDTASKNPADARLDLFNALTELQNVVNGRATADGVASLDSNTQVPAAQLPTTLTSSSGDITLTPSSTKVNIDNLINLQPIDYASLPASPSKGDVAYLTVDGSGSGTVEQLVFYNGSNWYKVSDPSGSAIPSS